MHISTLDFNLPPGIKFGSWLQCADPLLRCEFYAVWGQEELKCGSAPRTRSYFMGPLIYQHWNWLYMEGSNIPAGIRESQPITKEVSLLTAAQKVCSLEVGDLFVLATCDPFVLATCDPSFLWNLPLKIMLHRNIWDIQEDELNVLLPFRKLLFK